jgi:hypothetical protein
MAVTIQHLAIARPGVIAEVHEGGRRIEVLEEDGPAWTFTLRPATGQYHAPGHGPRCRLRP